MIKKAMLESLNHRYVIDTSKPFHVSWWATALGVSETELVEAVNAVGVETTDVYYYLRMKALESQVASLHNSWWTKTRPTSVTKRRAAKRLPGTAPASTGWRNG
jgi:hypothetical protein